MEPYADVTHRSHYAGLALGSEAPEPQEQLVDFRSGQRVSEVAAFAARLMMDSLAQFQPWQITDFQAAVDPDDPTKLNCHYKIRFPQPPLAFIKIDFLIVSSDSIRDAEIQALSDANAGAILDAFQIPQESMPMSFPLDRENGGCPVPGCGQSRTQEFNVQVSGEPAPDGMSSHDQYGDEEVSEFRRGSCCPKSEHRMYVTMALRREYQQERFGNPLAAASQGIPLTANPGLPPGRCVIRRRFGPDIAASPPSCQADVDNLARFEPAGNIIEILMSPVDLSIYTKTHYAKQRVILDPVTLTERVVPASESRACECGSEKTGLPTHSSWCPKGKP